MSFLKRALAYNNDLIGGLALPPPARWRHSAATRDSLPEGDNPTIAFAHLSTHFLVGLTIKTRLLAAMATLVPVSRLPPADTQGTMPRATQVTYTAAFEPFTTERASWDLKGRTDEAQSTCSPKRTLTTYRENGESVAS